MIYQSTNTWMTSRETCFLCSVQHGAQFWKCLWVYFGLKQVKSPKKVQQELITIERKMEKRGQKELLTTLECLTNYKKASQQLPSRFIAMRDSPFCKTFSPLFCFEGLVKKYRWGWAMRFWALCKGWVVQFSATLRGWVTLFYYIDRH